MIDKLYPFLTRTLLIVIFAAFPLAAGPMPPKMSKAGALDYLLKPVNPERLQDTLWIIAEHAGYGMRKGKPQ